MLLSHEKRCLHCDLHWLMLMSWLFSVLGLPLMLVLLESASWSRDERSEALGAELPFNGGSVELH
jgi:hypothetical protein